MQVGEIRSTPQRDIESQQHQRSGAAPEQSPVLARERADEAAPELLPEHGEQPSRPDSISSPVYERLEAAGRNLYSGLGTARRGVATRVASTRVGRGFVTAAGYGGRYISMTAGNAGLGVLSFGNAVGLSALRVGIAAGSNSAAVAILRGMDGVLTRTGMIENSVVATPVFLNRGVAITVGDMTAGQAAQLGAIFEGLDTIPASTLDVFLRLKKTDARARRLSPEFEQTQAQFEALIGEAGQTIRQLVEENDTRTFKQLNIERIAEDTSVRLAVTDDHRKCKPYNLEIEKLHKSLALTRTLPESSTRNEDIAEISEKIAALKLQREPFARPITDAYTKLLDGFVGEQKEFGFDPRCDKDARSDNDKANREVKRLVRMVARDIDSFAHLYLPEELNRFTTPQAVENGQKAVVLATDVLDPLWRAKRPVTCSDAMSESKAILGEYLRSLCRPQSIQATSAQRRSQVFRQSDSLAAPPSNPLTRHQQPGTSLGAFGTPQEPAQRAQEIEMQTTATASSGQAIAVISRQQGNIQDLAMQIRALEAKIDQLIAEKRT